MLGDVSKLFVFKSFLTTPSNVLPLHLKQTFPPIIWIFTEGEGNGIESRLPFKIFSTSFKIFLQYIYHDNPPSQYSPLTGILLTKNNYCQISRYLPIAIFCGAFQTYPGLCRSCMNTSLFIGLIKNFKSRKKSTIVYILQEEKVTFNRNKTTIWRYSLYCW